MQASLRGIVPDALVTVVNTQWFGSKALELTYKTPDGKVANQLLYRQLAGWKDARRARLKVPELVLVTPPPRRMASL